MNTYKLLALCDTPTGTSGFSRVSSNLLRRWHKSRGGMFESIDVWGINYRGEKHDFPGHIFQPGESFMWADPRNLVHFCKLAAGDSHLGRTPYTHVWIMQDTFMLSKNKFPEAMQNVSKNMEKTRKLKMVYYMPIDAPVEKDWVDVVKGMDVTVAYTEYGKREALKALPPTFNPQSIHVIPHGCDTAVYYPEPDRAAAREAAWRPAPNQAPFLAEDDFLLVNINANQRRKDIPRSFVILKRLKERWLAGDIKRRPKMLFHMPRESMDGYDLSKVGPQLELLESPAVNGPEADWVCSDAFFFAGTGKLGEDYLRGIYNSADLMLTTTLGEGWGFCLTEALGCGCPIAAPNHTSCKEIMARLSELETPPGMMTNLPVELPGLVQANDNSRFRPCVDIEYAVSKIMQIINAPPARVGLTPKAIEWLNWDRIAKEWQEIFKG